ncbi:hypothetical protein CYMTET_32668 [Cymbomonas tetramitiformis]|uniref:F-box domain-containing protein n=1 Tax=Cymbomonas tetramitiformis TaxID=36881 RepID=A0AAE0FEL5_9CHLO|nr:hypothetical protein CYMTET_32668 [Cymbomonas tetramitiformis]
MDTTEVAATLDSVNSDLSSSIVSITKSYQTEIQRHHDLHRQLSERLAAVEAWKEERTGASVDSLVDGLIDSVAELEAHDEVASKIKADTFNFLDLTDEIIILVLSSLQDCKSLCTIVQTCRRVRHLELKECRGSCWQPLCESEWRIRCSDPSEVACLETHLGIMDYFEEEVFNELIQRFGERYDSQGNVASEIWDGGASGDGSWKAAYRDRHIGWGKVLSGFDYLRRAGFPSEVAGRHHRYEIMTSVRYAHLLTQRSEGESARKHALQYRSALVALVALLENGSTAVQQQAAGAMANMLLGVRAYQKEVTPTCQCSWKDVLHAGTGLRGSPRPCLLNFTTSPPLAVSRRLLPWNQ